MKIIINSLEYQCWHEVGHAVVCLILGGDVESIEFVDEPKAKGLARARCVTNPKIRNFVACGGFATEYVLYKKGRLSRIDSKEFTQVVFINATIDREMYFNRTLSENDKFTKGEDVGFMRFAIGFVAPIICLHLSKMREVVKKLMETKKIEGVTIKQILN